MHFWKLENCGNDYVYLDGREALPPELPSLARRLSHRRTGIGADGLIVVATSRSCDFRMLMFNADGSQAEMCGNGMRGLAKLCRDMAWTDLDKFTVETLAGTIGVEITRRTSAGAHRVKVDMGAPRLRREELPMVGKPGRVLCEDFLIDGRHLALTALSMGNPHAVFFLDTIDDALVEHFGPLIENDPRFPCRVNVGFARCLAASRVALRVHERGSGETAACGTGACAAWVAGRLLGLLAPAGVVDLPGGELEVAWAGEAEPVFLEGPSRLVFEGRFEGYF